uniref:Uncharacterized protein n=1 Tax=Tolypothrix bouteillei VB521301 TaxID=1479485 RepID=A0A098XB63_9CYAN
MNNLTVGNKYYFLKPGIATYPCYSNTSYGILTKILTYGLLVRDAIGQEYVVGKCEIFETNPLSKKAEVSQDSKCNDIPF